MKTKKIPVIAIEELYERLRDLIVYNGISIINGVLLIWDEQFDHRILNVLTNEITKEERKNLLLICQDGDDLYCIWKKIPNRFKNDKLFLKDYNLKQYTMKTSNWVEVREEKVQ